MARPIDPTDAQPHSLVTCRRKARRIAIGVMALAAVFMLVMLHTMHSALKEMKAAGEDQHSTEGEGKGKWGEGEDPPDAACASAV